MSKKKSDRIGNVKIRGQDGKARSIDITWLPENKETVDKYASGRGLSFNALCLMVLKKHVESQAKKRRWKKTELSIEVLKKFAGKHQTLASYVRFVVLEFIDEHPLPSLPPPPPEDRLYLIKETRPEAIVYTIPIIGTKIVTSAAPEGGWRGIIFDPEAANSVAAWNTQNLQTPTWTKKPAILKALAFIASRIDDGSTSYFEVAGTDLQISAIWGAQERKWVGGEVINTKDGRRQEWERAGWYSQMSLGAFNYIAHVRRLQNLLCRAITAGDGGLDAKVPL